MKYAAISIKTCCCFSEILTIFLGFAKVIFLKREKILNKDFRLQKLVWFKPYSSLITNQDVESRPSNSYHNFLHNYSFHPENTELIVS